VCQGSSFTASTSTSISLKLYCTRRLRTLTRSVSEGVKPLPRLHFGLVRDVSSLAARSIAASLIVPLSGPNQTREGLRSPVPLPHPRAERRRRHRLKPDFSHQVRTPRNRPGHRGPRGGAAQVEPSHPRSAPSRPRNRRPTFCRRARLPDAKPEEECWQSMATHCGVLRLTATVQENRVLLKSPIAMGFG
jgi:hypothetical protein